MLPFKRSLYSLRMFGIFLAYWEIFIATECHRNQYVRDDGLLVRTTTGLVLGKYIKYFDTDIAAFFGIPYAKPPIGDKRFIKSEPAEPWNGIFLAHRQSFRCIQHPLPNMDYLPPGNYSEDCLYINIWNTKMCSGNHGKKKPVLVWIHGGAFVEGAADTDLYDGSKLVANGDVIVVSMNYRLGPLGFLNVGTQEAPGNVGLLDQVLALRWVKQNIEFFGGDVESITVVGESSGSWSINLHLISPLSRNLFHRAIMESGSMYTAYLADSAEEAKFKSNTLAVAMGCANDSANLNTDPSTVIKCLRTKDPLILSKMDNKLRANTFAYVTVGNEFLPWEPIEAFQAGAITQIEVLIGAVRDEGTLVLPVWDPETFSPQETPNLSVDDVKKAIPLLFTQLSSDLHRKIYNYYFKNISQDDGAAILNVFQYAVGDYLFNCPIMFIGEKLNAAYMYWFTHESSTDNGSPFSWLGVHHASDVSYVFGKSSPDGKSTLDARDTRFSDDIENMWVSFARNGYPLSDETRQQWPKFSPSRAETYELNYGNYKTIQFPRQEQCKFWRPIIASLQKHSSPLYNTNGDL